jgi:NADH-quinone oxidoreductase subunit H
MPELLIDIVKSVVIIGALLTMMPYLTLFERRVISRLQIRLGPNRVGPGGLLQPLADGLKLLFKEDIAPAPADRPLYLLAPAVSLFAAIAAFAVMPIGPTIDVAGTQIPLVIANLQVGVLYLVGVSSLGVYGLVLGGWASGSKYSLLGGLRAAAQIVSYELIIGLALVGVVLVGGSLSLGDLVAGQARSVPYVLLQPLGFLLYLIASVAEVNRAPFDLPEADTELVAG